MSPKFDSNSSWTLIHKLVQSYKNEDQGIIDTGHLKEIQPLLRDAPEGAAPAIAPTAGTALKTRNFSPKPLKE